MTLVMFLFEFAVLVSPLQASSGIASTSVSFISDLADSVKSLISSAGEFVVSTIRSTLAIFDRVETKELCIGTTCVNEDQLKELLLKNTMTANTYTPVIVSHPIINSTTTTSTTTDIVIPEVIVEASIATSTPEEIQPVDPIPAPVIEIDPTPESASTAEAPIDTAPETENIPAQAI